MNYNKCFYYFFCCKQYVPRSGYILERCALCARITRVTRKLFLTFIYRNYTERFFCSMLY